MVMRHHKESRTGGGNVGRWRQLRAVGLLLAGGVLSLAGFHPGAPPHLPAPGPVLIRALPGLGLRQSMADAYPVRPPLPQSWSQWGNSPTHFAAYAASPFVGGFSRALPVGSPVVGQVAVLAGGRAYVASNGGVVQAWNLTHSIRLWSHKLDNQVMTTPLVVKAGGRRLVIVGLGNARFRRWSPTQGWTRGQGSNGLVALDARTGRVRWRTPTVGEDMPTPAVWDGRVYEVTGSGTLLVLAAATGKPLWRLRLGGFDSMSSPMVSGETAYVVTNVYTRAYPAARSTVYAINLATHRVRWAASLPVASGLSDCTPALSATRLYIAGVARVAWVGHRARVSSVLFGLDRQTGTIVWQHPLGSGPLPLDQEEVGIPLAVGSSVYEANPANGEAFRLTAGGRMLWSVRLPHGTATGSPAAVGPTVVWGTTRGCLDAISAATGKPLAATCLGTGAIGPSSPVAVGHYVVIGTLGGWLDVVSL